MRKSLLLISLVFIFNSCAVKVKTIEDSFYNTKIYATDYMTIYGDLGFSYEMKIRLLSNLDKSTIIVEALYLTYTPFIYTENDKIVFKFSDGTLLDLNYDGAPIKSTYSYPYTFANGDTEIVSRTSYTINASRKINNIGELTAIRIETGNSFKNIDVSESFSKKLSKAFEDIKNYEDKPKKKVNNQNDNIRRGNSSGSRWYKTIFMVNIKLYTHNYDDICHNIGFYINLLLFI